MARILKKSLDLSPDETQTFDRGKMDLAKLGEITIGRVYYNQAGVGKSP
jgi:hypothetical protein